MSRGLGTVQRQALDVLSAAGGMLDSIAVAARVYGHDPVTLSEAVSVRRALRTLAKAGQVSELGRGFVGGRRMLALPEWGAAYLQQERQFFRR